MKRIIIVLAGFCLALTTLAQTDSTATPADTTKSAKESDTIRIGSMIIIKKAGSREIKKDEGYVKNKKKSNISTNWFILDLGFTNYDDQTNYASPAIQDPATGFAPGLGKENFKLKTGKSVNVNVWFFMQRLNVIKQVVNLKYGLGLELNNYRYKYPVKYNTNPTKVILDNSTSYDKNKLAADYLTVPLMLNFNFTPKRKKNFGFSAGASVGYLYSSRQKTITDEEGKRKKHDDFDLRPWKLAYIAELSLGPVKLYGSYAAQSMFERGLDQTPYSVGFRLSNW